MSDGPFPWANFGEADGSQNSDPDLPMPYVPLLPPLLPPMQQMMELDLTAEPVAAVPDNFEVEIPVFSNDFNDASLVSPASMDSEQVSAPDVNAVIEEQDWITELPDLGSEPPGVELQVMRLEDVVAQIDAEMAASTQVDAPLAVEAERRTSKSPTEKHIMFSLAGAKYAMPLGQVIEISRVPKLMPLPNVPEWLLGVTNLRGDIVSVVDLHAFLGLPSDSRRDASRMCVVRAERQEMITGLMVDRVDGLASLAGESFGWPTAGLEGNISQYLQGVGEHDEQLLRVLNLDSLLQAFDLSG